MSPIGKARVNALSCLVSISCLVCAASVFSFGQSTSYDSLYRELPNADGRKRFDILIELIRNCPYDSIERYYGQANELAGELRDKSLTVRALVEKGTRVKRANFDEGSRILKDALDQAKKLDDRYHVIKIDALLSYGETLDIDVYLQYARQASALAIRAADSASLCRIEHENYFKLKLAYRLDDALAACRASLVYAGDDLLLRARSFFGMGECFHEMQRYDSSFFYFEKARAIYEQTKNVGGLIDTFGKIAMYHAYLGNYLRAEENFSAAKTIIERASGDFYLFGNIMNNAGVFLQRWGNYPRALEYYYLAKSQFEKANGSKGVAVVLCNTGQVLSLQHRSAEAIRSFEEALDICREIRFGDPEPVVVDANALIAQEYLYLNDAGKAYEYITRALAININPNLIEWKRSRKVYGDILFARKEYAKARSEYESLRTVPTEELAERSPEKRWIAISFIECGKTSLAMGNLAASENELSQGLLVANNRNEKGLILQAYQWLTELHKARGNFDRALEYQTLFIAVKDSLYSEQRDKEINFITLSYQLQEKGHENELLKAENNLQQAQLSRQDYQRNILLIAIATLLIVSALVAVYLIKLRKINLQLNRSNAIIQQQSEVIRTKNQELEHTINELSSTQANLIHTSKMASIGVMAAGIAHEINNPTNFISGGVQALDEEINDLRKTFSKEDAVHFSTIEDLLSSIKNGVKRITDIVGGMRNFSRADSYIDNQVDVNKCLENVISILNHKLKSHIHLEVHLNHLPLITCSPGQINQVLLNIIDNAIQALDNVQNGARRTIRITSYEEGGAVVVSIWNNGPPIPAELHATIFDPFFTTKSLGQGVGLGLYISFNIVKSHKGNLTVRSTEKEGTTFYVKLPMRGVYQSVV